MAEPHERGAGNRRSPLEDTGREPPAQTRGSRSTRRSLAGSLAGVLLLIGFHALQAAHWAESNSAPPAWDQAVQLETAWDVKAALAAGDWKEAMTVAPKPGMPPFPPLYSLSLRPALGAADPAAAVVWVNWAYLALLCLALWGLGRHFIGDWEGLGAAVLFTCTPQLGYLAREALCDLPLTAWVASAYWALAASEGFKRKGPALLFGVLFAAAMLTKWSAFSYFLPALVPFFTAFTAGRAAGALLAAGAAALLAGPWYVVEAPVLLPRLVGAAADQAKPFWQGGASLSYVLLMAEGLELPLFALGLVGCCVPSVRRHTEDSWLLPAWFLGAFVFWTIVPNRQLRYLMPGLVPLGLLAMGPWPRGVKAGACALALAAAWNYPRGALPALHVNAGLPIVLFASEKPVREDWRLGDILKVAQARRAPGAPFSNIAFVANHPRLNGPTLNWERKRWGLDGLRIRGVTRRYTELCEFVLVKTGGLGPDSVTGQLPEVQKVMLDPGRWWQRGWGEVGRWPLPDGTEAVLFQRRRLARPPAGEGATPVDRFEERDFKAEGMRLDLGRWDAARGAYPRVEVTAEELSLRGLTVKGVDLSLEGLAFVSADESEGKRPDPLADPRFTRLDAVTVRSASVSADALAAFLAARVKGLTGARVTLDGGVASAEGRWRNLPVRVALEPKLLPDGSGLSVEVREASVSGLPIPVGLFGFRRLTLSFAPSSELPFKLSVPSLKVAGGRLAIGG